MSINSCDSCATWLEPGGGKKINLTKGWVYLCEPCLADLSRNNPALAEVDRLKLQIERDQSAYALMQKGMESQAELMDGLKQEARQLKAALAQRNALCRELAAALDELADTCDNLYYKAVKLIPAALAHAREQGMLEE